LGIVPQLLPLVCANLNISIYGHYSGQSSCQRASFRVAQLHPTPAVAGAARDTACAEIRRYESFERDCTLRR